MNTPRTDAEVTKHCHGSTMHAHCLNSSHLSGDFADFARKLETELAAMTALADRLAEALNDCVDKLVGWHGLYPDQVCADDNAAFQAGDKALAAYESHKKQKP